MRILIASDTYYPDLNGCSTFTQRLAKALQTRGHDVLVIAPSPKIRNLVYRHDGITVVGIRSVSPIVYKNFRLTSPIGVKPTIKRAIHAFRPDVVHIQSPFFIAKKTAEVAMQEHIPIVGTVHFMPENLLQNVAHYVPLVKVKQVESVMNDFMWKSLCKSFNTFDKILAPTKTAANLSRSHGIKKPVYPISCGIDLSEFAPGKRDPGLLRKYKIPKAFVFLYLGRLDKEKHIDVLISAFAPLTKKHNAHLLIGGVGIQGTNLRNQVRELGIKDEVTFTGKVKNKDLPKLYRLADCFVIASDAELQSLVTMEAMASGLPVLAADELALPELVHHKKNGFLFDLNKPSALTEYMQQLIIDTDLRRKMGEESLRIIKAHSLERSIKAYENSYKEVVFKKPPILGIRQVVRE